MAEGHFPKVIPWTAGYFAGLSGPQGGPADWTDGNGRNQRNHEIPGLGKGLRLPSHEVYTSITAFPHGSRRRHFDIFPVYQAHIW